MTRPRGVSRPSVGSQRALLGELDQHARAREPLVAQDGEAIFLCGKESLAEWLKEEIIDSINYAHENGIDRPEIRGWKWPD